MSKLWEKTYTLDALIEAFTVGDDYLLDARLVNADCAASMAHAAMLAKIGILKPAEMEGLKRELSGIVALNEKGGLSSSARTRMPTRRSRTI